MGNFLQSVSCTIHSKITDEALLRDFPEFILRGEGWWARELIRGNRLAFTSVLINDVIITRSGFISFFFFWCVGYSYFAWHRSCQCYSMPILLNEETIMLALLGILPLEDKQHLATTNTLLQLGFPHTKAGWFTASQAIQKKKQTRGTAQFKVLTFETLFLQLD